MISGAIVVTSQYVKLSVGHQLQCPVPGTDGPVDIVSSSSRMSEAIMAVDEPQRLVHCAPSDGKSPSIDSLHSLHIKTGGEGWNRPGTHVLLQSKGKTHWEGKEKRAFSISSSSIDRVGVEDMDMGLNLDIGKRTGGVMHPFFNSWLAGGRKAAKTVQQYFCERW